MGWGEGEEGDLANGLCAVLEGFPGGGVGSVAVMVPTPPKLPALVLFLPPPPAESLQGCSIIAVVNGRH